MRIIKTTSLLLAALITFGILLGCSKQTPAETVAVDYKYSVNADGTVTIEGYTGSSNELTIPEEIEGKKVQAIGDYAFYGNLNIKKISFPEGVTVLGECAFANCTELKEVKLPETVKKVDKAAFFGCTRLGGISFPDSLNSIGDGAFYFCESLKNVEFPANLTTTGEYVFGYCRGLETVTVNDKLTTISPQTFIGCIELKTVKLSENIESVGRRAFMNCTALTDINLPKSLDAVYDHAFDGCFNLTISEFNGSHIGEYAFSSCQAQNITFSDKLSYMGHDAFSYCNIDTMTIPSSDFTMESGALGHAAIKTFSVSPDNQYFTVKDDVLYSKDMSVLIAYPSYKEADTFVLPESVKTISDYAFSCCWNLDEFVFNSALEEIGDYAFYSAYGIDFFDIPETVNEIGKGAFCECSSITSIKIPDGVTEIKANTFEFCDALKEIDIPDSVETIEENAFKNCTSFTSFEISKGISKVTALSFTGCYSLEEFKVHSENPYYSIDNNCLVSKDKTTIAAYPNNLSNSTYTVADSVTKIEAYAFVNNNNLTELYLTDNIESVGDYAFGFYLAQGKDALDRISDFTVYAKDKGTAYNFAVMADLAIFKDKPVQNETELKLSAGDSFDFKIENAFDETVIYSASDRKVATVDKAGHITGCGNGNTTVIATVGTRNFILHIEVYGADTNANNNEYGYDFSDYRSLSKETHEQWENDYYNFNSKVNSEPASSPNIVCYSGSEYVPIVAVQTGDLSVTKADYGDDIGQYYYVSDGLSLELRRHKLNENLILFSGTNDVSNITGASSSLKDMQNAIGKTITDKAVVSTSVDHGVAAYFGTGSYHTVLEIYAPADLTKGAFIKSFSQYPYEQEILLDCNQSYKVLDAGVRIKSVTDFSGNTEEMTERYIKLVIVDNK